MEVTQPRAQQIVVELKDLINQAQTDQVFLPDAGDLQLCEAGLSSLGMVTFLVLIEDHFGITFDDDLPEDTLRSLRSIACYLAELGA